MSVYTSVLKLFKYDPVADKKSTFNITKALNENWDKIDSAMAAVKSKTATATLTAAGWSGNSQTVNVSGVTADNTVFVAPAPSDQDAYSEAKVKCTAQAAGALTFTCTTVPTADLTVNVVVMEV